MRSEGFDGVDGLEEHEGHERHERPAGAGPDDEVTRYAADVRAELADLPVADNAELWEDLEDHLREVAAEDAGTLRERLGEPATYARELRQAAGLPAPGETAAPQQSAPRWRMLKSRTQELRNTALQRVRTHRAGREVLDFLPTLRPAWWVLRAWVAVRLLEVLTTDVDFWHDLALVPRIGQSRLLGLVTLLVAIPASVYLARSEVTRAGWRRRGVLAAEGALAVVAVGLALSAGSSGDQNQSPVPWQVAYDQQHEAQPGLNQDGQQISNLWVFDKDGKPLDGVYIYDQDGRPVWTTPHSANPASPGVIESDTWIDGDGQLVANRYPKRMLEQQWNSADTGAGYVAVPPPEVSIPKGVHRPTGPDTSTQDPAQNPTQGSATPEVTGEPQTTTPTTPNPDSPSTPSPTTPATTSPGGAIPAHTSPAS